MFFTLNILMTGPSLTSVSPPSEAFPEIAVVPDFPPPPPLVVSLTLIAASCILLTHLFYVSPS